MKHSNREATELAPPDENAFTFYFDHCRDEEGWGQSRKAG
jgi:hypothetical protein